MRQELQRAVRRLATPGPKERDGRLGQSGALGELSSGEAGLFYR
jgi:hypothetical protein